MPSTGQPTRLGSVTFQDVILNKADGFVERGLQTTANTAEAIQNAVTPTPVDLNYDDTNTGYHSTAARLFQDIKKQVQDGCPFKMSLQNALAIVDALTVSKYGGGIDDKLMLLELVLAFLSRIEPRDSPIASRLQDKVVALLYYDLPHPPAALTGRKYRYRSVDGSGTALWNPEMGKAGSAYARTVQGTTPLPANQLPSPELLFDVLLKREKEVEHPVGLSTMFFAFANLVIHSIFNTDHLATEPINQTSSYLDLSPLYGNNQAEQDSIRLYDGTGRIYPDTFADGRLLRMPPSAPALLVIFSRNHNFVVQKLLEINERAIWTDPPPSDETRKKQQDEDLFQTARLVNCGWFMSTIFGDYLAGILGMVTEGNNWSLDPMTVERLSDHQLVARAEGNAVSIEFAALYHFHSAIGAVDEKWTEQMFRSPMLFGDTPWDDITIEQYENKMKQLLTLKPTPPNTWTFGNIKRTADGTFADADLAKIIQDATESPAAAFKARGTPHALRIVEIMAIQQHRQWGSCSLNEFRKFLGLRPYKTFEEWNTRPEIADAARRLYQHPDNIELYVGLQAEETKKPGPGAGLCPGFTTSRAILADAVALVRGDRFLTSDFTSFNLTAWGFTDCLRDPNNSSNGGVLGKLLTRTLPAFYPANSSYTNFPFVTPKAMNGYMNQIGQARKYSFRRPTVAGPVKVIRTFAAAQAALDTQGLASPVPEIIHPVLPGRGYLATLNIPWERRQNKELITQCFTTPNFVTEQVGYLERTTAALIKERSYTLVNDDSRSVNIVRDVLNIVPVHFVSAFVMGLPLKTEDNHEGTMLDQDLCLQLRDIYNYIFLDTKPSTRVAREAGIKEECVNFAMRVKAQFGALASEGVPFVGLVKSAYDLLVHHTSYTHEWLQRLYQSGKDRMELSNDALGLGVILAVEFSQALTHVVDSLLDPVILKKMRPLILSRSPTESVEPLKAYIAEVLRTRPIIGGTYRVAKKVMEIPEVGKLAENDRVYISYTEAEIDKTVFGAEASSIHADAAPASLKPLITGELVQLLGTEWLLTAIIPVLRAIFVHSDIVRAPGTSGKLLSVMQQIEGTQVPMYLNAEQNLTPWSSDLTINYTPRSPDQMHFEHMEQS